MAEPLLGHEPMVAEWDPAAGLYLVRAWVAGPAGTAGVRLSGGVEVDIDVAWPSRLAELRIPSVDGRLDDRTAAVVERLLGSPRLWRLLSNARPEPWPLTDDLYGRHRSDGRGVDRALQRTALARQIGDDRSASALRRGVALLEAASWAERSGARLGTRRLRSADALLGAELLLASLEERPLHLDPRTARDLAIVLRRAATATRDRPRTVARLLALAADLDVGPHFSERREAVDVAAMRSYDEVVPVAAAAARPMRRLARMSEQPVPLAVDRRSLPSMLEHAVIRAGRVSSAEVEVRVVGERDRIQGCWARAFGPVGTLLAMAPLRAMQRDGGALLLVAPEVIDDVVADVTDQPAVCRPSPALDAVESAITAGRAAASAERAGRRKEAAMAWHRSAEHWRAADDPTRTATPSSTPNAGSDDKGPAIAASASRGRSWPTASTREPCPAATGADRRGLGFGAEVWRLSRPRLRLARPSRCLHREGLPERNRHTLPRMPGGPA